MELIASLIALVVSLIGGATDTPAPAPAPAPIACEMVTPGGDAELDGQDFWSWRDAVSEDGELNFDGRGDNPAGVWSLDLWDGGTETLGYSVHEDSDIWNTMDCAADHAPYATAETVEGSEGGGESISGIYSDSELDCIIGPDGTKAWQNPGLPTPQGWTNIGHCED